MWLHRDLVCVLAHGVCGLSRGESCGKVGDSWMMFSGRNTDELKVVWGVRSTWRNYNRGRNSVAAGEFTD